MSVSRILNVSSLEEDTSRRPSGLHATQNTALLLRGMHELLLLLLILLVSGVTVVVHALLDQDAFHDTEQH